MVRDGRVQYLLDTNIVSEPLRPNPSLEILRELRQNWSESAIPAPVWHELRYGCVRLPPSRRRDTIERYLESVVLPTLPILMYDRHAADWHARERGRLSKMGRMPPFVDGQIAAIANVHGLVLVTSNLRHFSQFNDLQIETWAASGTA